MKKIATVIAVVAFITTVAFAQSSGNFSYGNTGSTHCVVNSNSGAITGGATCSQSSVCTGTTCTIVPGDTDCAGTLNAGIKTNSGNGNVFVVQPSAVIGLLTDVTVQKNATVNIGTSSAYAGVDFEVKATDPSGNLTNTIPNFPITYAARFVQISTNLFDVLGTQCTGTNTIGGVTTADGCFISFNESTVSAHSFQWIVPELQTGVYGIAANWKASLGNTGISRSLTCVGPVNLTVQQNKVFNFNTIN
jgi:hypothetical protein